MASSFYRKIKNDLKLYINKDSMYMIYILCCHNLGVNLLVDSPLNEIKLINNAINGCFNGVFNINLNLYFTSFAGIWMSVETNWYFMVIVYTYMHLKDVKYSYFFQKKKSIQIFSKSPRRFHGKVHNTLGRFNVTLQCYWVLNCWCYTIKFIGWNWYIYWLNHKRKFNATNK